MTQTVRSAVLLVMVGMLVGACSKKQPPVQPEPQPPAVQQQPQPPAATPTATRDDAAEREAEMRRVRAILEQIIYFDYDESSIRVDAQETLAAKVPYLRQNPGIRMRIEGHADERGSVEYNLALGMRRANAVRDYLLGFGLDASRFDIQSLGEDRPMANGSNEAAWAQNRRAEFRVSTGM
jgi:peptidoglycan-associated lipoprotein